MLENLLQLVREYGEEQVVQNTDIPDEQNHAVMAEASYAVAGTLQQALADGQMDDLLRMFNSGSSAQIMGNPVAQTMQSGFVDSITSKLGINKNVAMGLAATLIPIVVSKLVKRTRSAAPEDSGFDLSNLIGSLTGNTGGIGNLISQVTGGGGNGGLDIGGLLNQFAGHGGGGIADVLSNLTNGARTQQQSGGLDTLIRGFFGQ